METLDIGSVTQFVMRLLMGRIQQDFARLTALLGVPTHKIKIIFVFLDAPIHPSCIMQKMSIIVAYKQKTVPSIQLKPMLKILPKNVFDFVEPMSGLILPGSAVL